MKNTVLSHQPEFNRRQKKKVEKIALDIFNYSNVEQIVANEWLNSNLENTPPTFLLSSAFCMTNHTIIELLLCFFLFKNFAQKKLSWPSLVHLTVNKNCLKSNESPLFRRLNLAFFRHLFEIICYNRTAQMILLWQHSTHYG